MVSGHPIADEPLLHMLQQRVKRSPTHSDSWRLVGKYYADRGNLDAAKAPLERAIELDPNNAAAHFCLGEVLLAQNQSEIAAEHFKACISIAPESEYAQSIFTRQLLPAHPDPIHPTVPADTNTALDPKAGNPFSAAILRTPADNSATDDSVDVQRARYQIESFDGSDDLERRFDQLEADATPDEKNIRLLCEFGLLYNSNVSLTPISRELFDVDAESFQAIFNPEVEWIAARGESTRIGPLMRSYSTLNESDQQQFNLMSFQPGWFYEHDRDVGNSQWIGRFDYVYAADLLDGNRIGDRHSGTLSLIIIRPDLDVIYSYITTSYTDFVDDGLIATETSLDGPSISGGISRFFQTTKSWIPTYTLGVDLESAATRGSDFRYRALTTHGSMTFQLSDRWRLIPTTGIGYRDYFAFTGSPNRDELTSRIHLRLKYQINTITNLSLVSGHDRFASKNQLFDAQRTQAGLVMTVNY